MGFPRGGFYTSATEPGNNIAFAQPIKSFIRQVGEDRKHIAQQFYSRTTFFPIIARSLNLDPVICTYLLNINVSGSHTWWAGIRNDLMLLNSLEFHFKFSSSHSWSMKTLVVRTWCRSSWCGMQWKTKSMSSTWTWPECERILKKSGLNARFLRHCLQSPKLKSFGTCFAEIKSFVV
jgi:hypothetical protein